MKKAFYFYKMKHWAFLMLCFLIFADAGISQRPGLKDIALNFTVRWEQDADSAKVDPQSVIGYIFYDSCYSESKIEKFNEISDLLINLKYIRIDGPPCQGVGNSLVNQMFKFDSLNTIYDSWGGCFQSTTITYLETFIKRIMNLETMCADTVDEEAWQHKIFEFVNLVDLSIRFKKSTILAPEITQLTHLEGLKLFSHGNIQFPDNFHEMKSLKEIDMSHCFRCKNLPDTLPASVERINIFTTGITTLPSNLTDLKNLTHLDIGCSKIKEFPKNFNFWRLHYFSAEESLFSAEEWERIKKEVFTVITTCSAKGKSPFPKRG